MPKPPQMVGVIGFLKPLQLILIVLPTKKACFYRTVRDSQDICSELGPRNCQVVRSASVWLIRVHRAFFVPRICSVPIWHSYVYVSLTTWRQSGCCCESGNQRVFGALVCNLRICTRETYRFGKEFRGCKLQRGGRKLGLIFDAIRVWVVVDVDSNADTGVGISEVANFKRQVTR